VVVKNLASPGSGLVDAYGKAFVLLQLPHGLLAVSIATTFVPILARLFQTHQLDAFGDRLSQGIRLTVLLSLPASIIAAVLAVPIVRIVLGYGNFDDVAVTNTARALTGLAIGLVGFSVYLFALRGFYAKGDTRTPFMINLVENAINIILAFIFVSRFDVLGLGLAFGFAYLLGALVALVVLARTTPTWNLRPLVRPGVGYVTAGIAMIAVVHSASRAFDTPDTLTSLADVVISGTIGIVVYVVTLVLIGDTDVRRGVARYSSESTTRSSR
jgi:putative peptidoglycan lipid II flippase